MLIGDFSTDLLVGSYRNRLAAIIDVIWDIFQLIFSCRKLFRVRMSCFWSEFRFSTSQKSTNSQNIHFKCSKLLSTAVGDGIQRSIVQVIEMNAKFGWFSLIDNKEFWSQFTPKLFVGRFSFSIVSDTSRTTDRRNRRFTLDPKSLGRR